MPKILIIEDEAPILSGLTDVFVYHGYTVDTASDGRAGLEKYRSGSYDLVLLDVMLPLMDGFTVCNLIRETSLEQPIIMLTAKSAEEDIITGLTLGADDYVAKPFSVRELVLRVESVLKRSRRIRREEAVLEIGDGLRIDTLNLVELPDPADRREPMNFTRREIEILEYLKDNSERPVSREELLTQVWGYKKASEVETRTVDIHIAKLRRKIEPDPKLPRFLVTLRGEGYRLVNGSGHRTV
ncbi:MAG: response regulator transcription factor [Pseudomonadota bacterium]